MNTWLITDTHLGHEMLVNRGYRPVSFEDQILVNLAQIPEQDVLIHMGDVCWGHDQYHHHRLLSACDAHSKILIRGNHDKKTDSWYRKAGWSLIVKELWLEKFGFDIVITHEPKRWKPGFPWAELRNLHGHTHGNNHRSVDVAYYYDPHHHIEIALEHCNYQPLKLTEKLIRRKT